MSTTIEELKEENNAAAEAAETITAQEILDKNAADNYAGTDIDAAFNAAAAEVGITATTDDETGPASTDEDGATAASGASGATGTDEDEAAASGPTGAAEAPAASGPTGASSAATGASGASGATEATGASGASGASAPAEGERDKDLEKNLSPNTAPKTKAVIEEFKLKAVEARNERDALKKEIEELKKNGTGGVPETVKTEIEALRNRVREIDIMSDPTLKSKYDDKIEANQKGAIEILKGLGLGEVEGKEVPGYFKSKFPNGITLRSLAEAKITLPSGEKKLILEVLEQNGEFESIEEIKSLLLQNSKIAKEKEKEVADWKTNWETKTKEREASYKAELEKTENQMRTEADAELQKVIEAHPFLKRPPAPLPNDAPAVKKAKEAALEAHNKQFQTFQKTLVEAVATDVTRLKAIASGILIRDHVVPKLQETIAERDARIKELEGKIAAVKKSSSIKPSPTAAPKGEEEIVHNGTPTSLEDALDKAAASVGIRTRE